MKVRVRLFALARQLAGTDMIEVELSDSPTIAELRRRLPESCPPLEALSGHFLLALDAQYAADAAPIPPGGDVACIPPVSGG